uniref:Uncharacterized protein n=1 Tax=Anguilla anguilla TaxID=7936 RepID=A0A0E9WSC1_ANGAN
MNSQKDRFIHQCLSMFTNLKSMTRHGVDEWRFAGRHSVDEWWFVGGHSVDEWWFVGGQCG